MNALRTGISAAAKRPGKVTIIRDPKALAALGYEVAKKLTAKAQRAARRAKAEAKRQRDDALAAVEQRYSVAERRMILRAAVAQLVL